MVSRIHVIKCKWGERVEFKVDYTVHRRGGDRVGKLKFYLVLMRLTLFNDLRLRMMTELSFTTVLLLSMHQLEQEEGQSRCFKECID